MFRCADDTPTWSTRHRPAGTAPLKRNSSQEIGGWGPHEFVTSSGSGCRRAPDIRRTDGTGLPRRPNFQHEFRSDDQSRSYTFVATRKKSATLSLRKKSRLCESVVPLILPRAVLLVLLATGVTTARPEMRHSLTAKLTISAALMCRPRDLHFDLSGACTFTLFSLIASLHSLSSWISPDQGFPTRATRTAHVSLRQSQRSPIHVQFTATPKC